MSASKALLLSVLLLFPGYTLYGQDGRTVRVVPERPLAGSAFDIMVELPGESAEDVESVEPRLSGAARYEGSDVRPEIFPDALSGALVEYHFMAEGTGLVEVFDVAVRVKGRIVRLGTWVVEVLPGPGSNPVRAGSWKAPVSVFAGEVFNLVAIDPDGLPADCPGLAVRGALVEPLASIRGTFRVLPLEAGSLRLPLMALEDEAGPFEIDSRVVVVRSIPVTAAHVDAVGGPWQLELALPEIIEPKPGDAIPWELKAVGNGWAGAQAAPRLSLSVPAGGLNETLSGTPYSERGAQDTTCISGIRGALIAGEPGEYVLVPQPFTWFDTASRTVRQAVAPPIRMTVRAPREGIKAIPEEFILATRRLLDEKAGKELAWSEVQHAAQASDWNTAKTTAYAVMGIDTNLGSLLLSRIDPASKAALAALSALAEADSARVRAEACAVMLRLGRSAFPLPGIESMAGSLEASFGNLSRPPYVLPAFGLFMAGGFASLVLAAAFLVFMMLDTSGRIRTSKTCRLTLVAVAVIGTVLVSLSIASWAERSGDRFISLGGMARPVPSMDSAGGYVLDAGKTGKVLESAAGWHFVEPDGEAAAWLVSGDVVLY